MRILEKLSTESGSELVNKRNENVPAQSIIGGRAKGFINDRLKRVRENKTNDVINKMVDVNNNRKISSLKEAGFYSGDIVKNDKMIQDKARRVREIIKSRAARGEGYEKSKLFLDGKKPNEVIKDLEQKTRYYNNLNMKKQFDIKGRKVDVMRNMDDNTTVNGLSDKYNNLNKKLNDRAAFSNVISDNLISRDELIKNRINNNISGSSWDLVKRYRNPGNENPHLVKRDIKNYAISRVPTALGIGAGLGMAGYGLYNYFTGDEDVAENTTVAPTPDVIPSNLGADKFNEDMANGNYREVYDYNKENLNRLAVPASILGGAGMLSLYNNRRNRNENPYS